MILSFSEAAAACPSLSAIYPGEETEWSETLGQLEGLFDSCLQSAEYFALRGAAQLNTGALPQAIESLERALLLDPDNGAALIDYGVALYNDGQLFAALDVNQILIERDDVPEGLREQIVERQALWQSQTVETAYRADLSGGFDNNLNGGPRDSQIAITLSGESIYLALNENFRSVEGPFLISGLAAMHTRLSPGRRDALTGQIRGRFSENRESDVIQLAGAYDVLREGRRSSIRQWLGASHLLFSGEALFTGVDLAHRFQLNRRSSACDRYLSAEFQHQTWHTQRLLDGVEVRAALGGLCSFNGLEGHRFGLELALLQNYALRDRRLGGDRDGWQMRGQWQYTVGRGLLAAQIELGSLLDGVGYSPLLDDNSRRVVSRRAFNMQFLYPGSVLGRRADLTVNVYHQDQSSNIGLFKVTDTSLSIGLQINF